MVLIFCHDLVVLLCERLHWLRPPASCYIFLRFLQSNKSKGRHHQPFFLIFVARSGGCGVHPKLKLWAQTLMKNEKMKKRFCLGSMGAPGGRRIRFALQSIFVFAKQIFWWHLHFFHFGISNCFVIAKEEFQKKVLQRNQVNHPNANLEVLVDLLSLFLCFLEYWTLDLLGGHATDTWIKNSE